jgi:hypothetical protein
MSLRKALGLTFFAALALMAISAPGASATTGELKILNAAETVLSELNATLGGEVDLLGVLHVPAINLEIHCVKFTVKEGVYLASDNVGHAKLVYHECKVYQLSPLSELVGCKVYPTAADKAAKTNAGLIEAKGLLLVLLHTNAGGSKPVVRAKEIHAPFFFENCPTGATALVTGGLTLLAHDGPETHLVKHLFQEATGNFKLDQLKYGLNDANILGSVWVFLEGEHAGRKWGIV